MEKKYAPSVIIMDGVVYRRDNKKDMEILKTLSFNPEAKQQKKKLRIVPSVAEKFILTIK